MMHSPREITLEFDNRIIAARQWGDPAGEPVLALHGWLDNCASFDRLAPLLTGLNLVAVDMAGHGQSYHRSRDASYNIWEEVEDVIGMAQALGWRKFSLLGHSRGAIASLLTAGAFPNRVKRMALIDGLLPPPAEDAEAPETLARAIAQRERYGAREPRRIESLEVAVAARKNGMFRLSDRAAHALVVRGTRPLDGGWVWSNDPRLMGSSSVKLNAAQIQAFLERANMPVRLVLAREGIANMIERIRPVVAQLDNVAVLELPGGHHLHMEEGAEAIAAWFGAFLRGEEG